MISLNNDIITITIISLRLRFLEIPHKDIWVSWGVLFKGLGVQKGTQTPCWLRPWFISPYTYSNRYRLPLCCWWLIWPTKSWMNMGTHLRVLHEWIPTWLGLDGFQKSLRFCPLDQSSLSIGRVNLAEGGIILLAQLSGGETVMMEQPTPI